MLSNISRKLEEKTLLKKVIDRLSRNLNSFSNGLFVFLSKCKQGISDMLKKKPKSMQLSMFDDVGFGWC